ncbi:MAG: recombinase family protein [Candidatus Eremiobacteraeota bacterium]|nr:recombinase family protein [Candidatus Eremiobacteraeota bacterium]
MHLSSPAGIVAYYRVSTRMQGFGGLGMEAQRRSVHAYAEFRGLEIVAAYEEVESARRENLKNRPQLVRALAHARRSGAVLVIARFDRLARNVFVTAQLLESGVEFVACDNPHANRMTIQIIAVMAEQESRLISERVKAAFAAMRARGIPHKSNRRLTPEEIARGQRASAIARRERTKEAYADLVPVVTEMRGRGLSIYQVCDALNAQGQRNQRGLRWQPSAMAAFLRRVSLPKLPEALRTRGPVADSIRAKGIVAAAASLRRRTDDAYVDALPIAVRLLGEGRSRAGIARDLNDLGLRVQTGSPWRSLTVLALLRRAGALAAGPARRHAFTAKDQDAGQRAAATANRRRAVESMADVEPLARRLLATGYSYLEIAETLNDFGFKPRYAERWTKSILYLAMRRIDERNRESKASRATRRLPDTWSLPCRYCGATFQTRWLKAMYCSAACCQKSYRHRRTKA